MSDNAEELKQKIALLESRLADAEGMIEAIKAGEVDGFAINMNGEAEVFTLQSGDYAYRVLVEKIGEGAVNMSEEGLIVYTNTSFCELLKRPYERIIGSSIFNWVHPDSRNEFNIMFREAIKGSSKGEINFKLPNRGPVPVYVSLSSLRPKLATVGMVVTDFTQKKKDEETIVQYQADLEVKNKELVQTNAELASFAYVASHDLQEPLRKIKTFSSRIIDKDDAAFSEETKHYFARIVAASDRMQDLIESLLDYSRSNTSERVFALTNLNVVVEDVKNTLKEQIEKTEAQIETSKLPVLKVVPFQFHQLFLNIIGNAIKYRKADEPVRIKITASIVSAAETPAEGTATASNYWKIQISDNGIGFEEKYSEKIFELFYRLHGKSEYEGTGIGLALCKKIVQNHGGFLQALSKPDVGSTFSIFLPVS